ncbi:MAG: protein phosphatase 2C domain-containing protein [Ktedonobacterales bacterium]|nr:protein phosphatase 2C domain-containing protein [Ktedonobacterales bacterium]
MECIHCGATLRPSARFCNVCGLSQALLPQPVGISQVASDVAEEETAISPIVDAPSPSGGRAARPARVPRAHDVPSAWMPQLPDVDVAAGDGRGEDLARLMDVETVKQVALPSREGGVRTIPLPGHGGAEQETSPADGLPWPLPPSIIVGGRYRVEAILSAGPAEPDAENVYRVSDLQGYERCWSCHTKHGPEASGNRFCRECNADMLDHDYRMRERLIPAGAPEAAVPSEVAAAAASAAGERFFIQGQRMYHVAQRAEEAPRFSLGAHLVAGMATDRGQSRPHEPNEDSQGLFVLARTTDTRTEPLALGIVADGLGGHANGQEASRTAVRAVLESILRTVVAPRMADERTLPAQEASARESLAREALERALRMAVIEANAALCELNEARKADMGSTLVAVLIASDIAYIANVGDSRAYVLERGTLRRITTDHSLVEQLIASEVISPAERYDHPQRNQILRSLGERETEVDIFAEHLCPGMRLLLCSDGLWEMVRDDESARILCEVGHPQAACEALVRVANAHGGEDNITALVIDFLG